MSATRRGLLHVIRVPGLLAYQAGVARQEALAAACTGGGPDTLLVCEVCSPNLCVRDWARLCDSQLPPRNSTRPCSPSASGAPHTT